MKIKTPSFWYRPQGSLLSALLSPLSVGYGVGRAVHCALKSPEKLDGVKIICIGNLNAGGSGKTPTAMALLSVMQECKMARAPAFLLRGYGGTNEAPMRVDPARHNAEEVGEEALLLAAYGPVYVARDRLEGARLATREGADVIIMDDGYQSRRLQADIYLAVIDGTMGLGNQKMLPAGPLREPISKAFARADGFVFIGEDHNDVRWQLPGDKPVFEAKTMVRDVSAPPKEGDYFAFAGIGYPKKFFAFMRNVLSLNIVMEHEFPDHYAYSAEDIDMLREQAQEQGLQLITTEKDMLQIRRLSGVDVSDILILPIYLQFQGEGALIDFLQERIRS